MDLLDFFRGVYQWSKLYRLIEFLPWHSQYKLAIADDPELGRLVAAAIEDLDDLDTVAVEIRLRDWDPFRDMTTGLQDKLSEVVIACLAPHMTTPPKMTPAPRPKTARQKAIEARERVLEAEFYDDMVSMSSPLPE